MATQSQLWTQWIYQDAPKFGVDPKAAWAISTHEGLSGAVGDAGTSFGPFQLHRGGALPSGRGRAWAESRAGVDYALRAMAQSGARGLRGRGAIAAISRNFERPSDVPAEISDAWLHYQRNRGYGGRQAQVATLAQNVARGGKSQLADPMAAQRFQAISSLLQSVNPDLGPLFSVMGNRITMAQEADTGKAIPIVKNHSQPVTKGENRIVNMAKQYLGTPYKWGGSAPGGFDCSGFVQYLYGRAGIKLGRTTYQQVKEGKPVGRGNLKAGDVIFFKKGTDVHHEALYIGHGKFIHSPHTGDVVKISSLSDPYYTQQFAGGRRFV